MTDSAEDHIDVRIYITWGDYAIDGREALRRGYVAMLNEQLCGDIADGEVIVTRVQRLPSDGL